MVQKLTLKNLVQNLLDSNRGRETNGCQNSDWLLDGQCLIPDWEETSLFPVESSLALGPTQTSLQRITEDKAAETSSPLVPT